MVKGNPRVRNVLIVLMVGGLAVVILGEIDQIQGLTGDINIRLTTFELISVDQDPVTGEIRGNIILGKPEIQGSAWTGVKKSSNCPQGTQGSLTTGVMSFGSGSSSGGCTVGYAEWDLHLVGLPEDLAITSMTFQLSAESSERGFANRNCKIGIIEQPLSTIQKSDLVRRAVNPDFVLEDSDWCSTTGAKTIIVDQTTIDAFERALMGDGKITLAFTPSSWTKGTGCCWEADNDFWGTEGSWIINGFAEPISCDEGFHQVGFKCEPLECEEGFEVNGNICSQIICPVGEELIGSTCTPIECNVGEKLVGNLCEPIICPVGTTLVGNDCEPILCDEGFTLSGNECTPIVCPVGTELVGSQCQEIACPLGTFLQGNNCVEIICPSGTFLEGNNCAPILCEQGEMLVGDICKQVECPLGEKLVGNNCEEITCETGTRLIGNECEVIQCESTEELVGNECVDKPLECPDGTVPNNNICIQVIPQLMATGADISFLTIAGLSMFIIATAGFVVRAIRLRGF